jgi:16S rRNA (cytidine1402-2'-O)-methyltransferase
VSLKGRIQVIVYETARRLKATLGEIRDILGDVHLVIAREMTKIHEEVLRGTVEELSGVLKERELKGEITIVLRAPKAEEEPGKLSVEIKKLLEAGSSVKDAAALASKKLGLPRTVAYGEALKIKKDKKDKKDKKGLILRQGSD